MIQPQTWNGDASGPITLEAVAALHQPAYKFRTHKIRSNPHTPFCGTGVAFTLYVLSGSCTVARDWTSQPITLRAGEFCRTPGGEYVMSFPEPIEYIKVLELPEQVWSLRQAQLNVQDNPASTEQLIRRVIDLYGPAEILAMLDGTSQFTSDENPGSDGLFSADFDRAQKIELSKLIAGARLHLKYMQLTGHVDGPAVLIGKRVHGSYPQDFARWLDLGAPGIFRPELETAIAFHQQAREP